MSAIWHDSGIPSFLAPATRFSFFEQAQVESPAPIKYHLAQEWRHYMLRDKGTEWHQYNVEKGHKIYMSSRGWWLTIV